MEQEALYLEAFEGSLCKKRRQGWLYSEEEDLRNGGRLPFFARAASFAARPDVSDVETPTRQRLPVAAINDNFQPVPSLIID